VITWQAGTARLLPRLIKGLIKGRKSGLLFLTDRKARVQLAPADLDAATGRVRLSYRQAAVLRAGAPVEGRFSIEDKFCGPTCGTPGGCSRLPGRPPGHRSAASWQSCRCGCRPTCGQLGRASRSPGCAVISSPRARSSTALVIWDSRPSGPRSCRPSRLELTLSRAAAALHAASDGYPGCLDCSMLCSTGRKIDSGPARLRPIFATTTLALAGLTERISGP
jgi:hypothetical protein